MDRLKPAYWKGRFFPGIPIMEIVDHPKNTKGEDDEKPIR
jgi:hypothetical protein